MLLDCVGTARTSDAKSKGLALVYTRVCCTVHEHTDPQVDKSYAAVFVRLHSADGRFSKRHGSMQHAVVAYANRSTW